MQVSDRIDHAGECRQARCQHQEERFAPMWAPPFVRAWANPAGSVIVENPNLCPVFTLCKRRRG